MIMQSSKESTVKSADRVLDLLELLCSTGHPMTHTEISSALSIPKSSMSQLLGNLERRGYLSFQAGPDVYELGPAVSRLAEGSKSSSDLLHIAQNVVDVIAKTTRETASFYKRRGDQVERVTVANSLASVALLDAGGRIDAAACDVRRQSDLSLDSAKPTRQNNVAHETHQGHRQHDHLPYCAQRRTRGSGEDRHCSFAGRVRGGRDRHQRRRFEARSSAGRFAQRCLPDGPRQTGASKNHCRCATYGKGAP
jgi:hypothetical protein